MASPQKENGYTAIANEIFDVLVSTYFPSGERQVLDCILRKTYGFNKKKDSIALSQFITATKLSRRTIIYALQNLEAKKIILIGKSRSGLLNDPNEYSFNKDHETWVVQNSSVQVKKNRDRAKASSAKRRSSVVGSAKPSTKVVQNSVKKVNSFAPTKDTIQKTITKDTEGDVAVAVEKPTKYNPQGAEIIKAFSEFNPACSKYYGNKTQRAACDHLIEVHGLEKVLAVVAILPKTNTMQYVPTITTPYALDEKWASLESAMLKKKAEQTSNLSKFKVAFH